MKKLLVFILCVLLMCATPIVAFAEGESADVVETEGVVENNSTTTEETPTESEIQPPTDAPAETPSPTPEADRSWADVKTNVSDKILDWVYENYDKALVALCLLMSALHDKVRDKRNRKDIGTLNNNAITIATDGKAFMGNALTEMQNVSGAVVQYDSRITALLQAYSQCAEDKLRLESELVEIKNYLKTATDANIEFANELADLIGLSNIPNYKKEELGARHVAFVDAIIAAEAKAAAAASVLVTPTEVKEDDGETKEI